MMLLIEEEMLLMRFFGEEKINSNFLYLCAQIKTAGAIKVTKNRMEKYIHITVRDRLATRRTAEVHNPAVINSHTAFEHDD